MNLELGGINDYLRGGLETADVSVVTCSLPTRPDLLAECIQGIVDQTVKPKAAYIGIDFKLIGEAENQNNLATLVDTEWIAFCHDDDVWLPNHLESMLAISDNAECIFTDYILEGRGSWHPGHFCYDWDMLRTTNWIPPSACMMKTELFWEVGGWQPLTHFRDWVDWKMWKTLLDRGTKFKCTCKQTFRYRFNVNEHHKNGSTG